MVDDLTSSNFVEHVRHEAARGSEIELEAAAAIKVVWSFYYSAPALHLSLEFD